MIKAEWTNADTLDLQPTCNQLATDCISRQAVQDILDRVGAMHPYRQIGNRESYSTYNEAWTDAINMADAELNSLQPEQKTGRWRHYEGYLTCSECRTEYDDDIMTHCCDDVPKFCPNCGAKMEDENE